MSTSLAYQISRNHSHLACPVHHINLSTKISKELAVVKVCCTYFKDEVNVELEKQFGVDFVKDNIRFSLPVNEIGIPKFSGSGDE